MTNKAIFCIIALFIFIILFYCSIVSPTIFMTIDESINFMLFSRHGAWYTLTHYSAPNNHIFFTFLQSMFIPPALLPMYPHFTRFINVCASIAFFIILYFFAYHFLRKKSPFFLMVIFVVFFFLCPVVTIYFIVARGYIIGLVMLLIGIFLLLEKKYFLSSILLILSGWTVPTYIYTFPLLYLMIFFYGLKSEKRMIIVSGILVLLGLCFCYLPVLPSILSQTTTQGNSSFLVFLIETKATLSNYSYISWGKYLNSIYVLAYIFSLTIILRKQVLDTIKKFIVLLTVSIASYLGVIGLLSISHIAFTPYIRNGLFIPIYISMTMLTAIIISKKIWEKAFLSVLVIGNICIGIYLFCTFFTTGQKSFYLGIYEQFSLTASDITLLKEHKLLYLPKAEWVEGPILEYFSYIYSVPIDNNPKKETPTR